MLCSTPQSRIYALAATPAVRIAKVLFLTPRTGSAVMLFNLHHDALAMDAHDERVRTVQTLTGAKSDWT
jgi:hypothetical protein